MPIDYKKYPPGWKTEIRPRILKRAENKCEFCGVFNRTMVLRPARGSVPFKWVEIVLTIAHLDHDEENWDVTDDRLAALCQKCHLSYDAPERMRRRRMKLALKRAGN